MFFRNNIPRWLTLIIDLLISACALFLAFNLRFNFNISDHEIIRMKQAFMLVIPIRLLLFIVFRTYADIVRYTSTLDGFRVLITLVLGSMIFMISNIISYYIYENRYIVPFSIIIIDLFATSFLLIGYRVLVKLTFLEIKNPRKGKSDVIIFGAGDSGLITKRSLDRDAGTKYKVVAFLDDNERKIGMKLEGIPIYPTSKLSDLLKSEQVAHLIISIPNLSSERKSEIVEESLNYNTKVLIVPPVFNWINGELSFKQIKKIKIEELLERDVISIDNKKISSFISGKVIVITGAAGSIGSEIVRQVLKFNPKKVICIDRSENSLYQLELGLSNKYSNYEIVIADITDNDKMQGIFENNCPNICFHAAAYKHVPLMESHVNEAVKNNLYGTKNIADLCIEYKCERFVMISTDKAVNPTSVMGATKRLAEIYTQTIGKTKTSTKFITTRFGNVLGSNGSVIPLFRDQIENGGPVTVTHPEITRFFMTIREACQLVLEAGVMGNGGEIFIFDMGKSVKIVDLAKKMIKLSGLTIGKDIQIIYTGLRQGEKLYEELLNNTENTIPTYHERILIAKVKEYDINEVEIATEELSIIKDEMQLVAHIKKLIPEYKSHNSKFEKLD